MSRIFAIAFWAHLTVALENGMAKTPQMGYNTWNSFGAHINEDLIKETADAMVDLGLLKAGYKYLVIDDAWQDTARDELGKLHANPDRFPSGMLNVSRYIQSKGLKFGIYSDAGPATCANYPGSRGFELEDANSFAAWEADYLKYDNCNASISDGIVERYAEMRDALNKTGRPILFSVCSWGDGDPWAWGPQMGNSWRTTGDIEKDWLNILRCLDNTVGLARFAGPGGWNDPDMLEVGNGALTLNEQQSHFALWAVLKAPLLAGADLRSIPPESLRILLAKEIIAVNQDPLGVAGDLVWKLGPYEVYASPLKGGDRAVVLLNRHASNGQYTTRSITVNWEDIGYPQNLQATVRDLYLEKDLGRFTGSFSGFVEVHGCRALRITPDNVLPQFDKWRPWK